LFFVLQRPLYPKLCLFALNSVLRFVLLVNYQKESQIAINSHSLSIPFTFFIVFIAFCPMPLMLFMANKNYIFLFNSITVIMKISFHILWLIILKDQENIRFIFNYISLIGSEIYFFLILSMSLIFHQINKWLNTILQLRNRFPDSYVVKQKGFYIFV
jgi:hypothetical protein